MADMRQGVSAVAHRVLDKAEVLRGSLRGAVSPGDELELEFGAVADAVSRGSMGGDGPKLTDLVRGAALFLVMAERLADDCSDGAA
jgi:hypothetical protein